MNNYAFVAKDITKSYVSKTKETTNILNGLSLSINTGDSVALVGESGAGKSTLLHILGLLDKPTSGSLLIDNISVFDNASENDITRLRAKYIGFIYQFHHLLGEFSALENVMVPQILVGKSRKESIERSKYLLSSVGLAEKIHNKPAKLSGGEQQRVALARALANSPKILLADEPTGNLDSRNALIVTDLLLSIVKQEKLTLLVATHSKLVAGVMGKTITIVDGLIKEVNE